MNEVLEHMANRVADDPFFLARPLAEYARSERLDDASLASRLGCRPEELARLRLCRAPLCGEAEFRADVTRVAAAFGIDPGILADAVRHGEGLARLRVTARAAGEPGHFLAARDSAPDPPAENSPP